MQIDKPEETPAPPLVDQRNSFAPSDDALEYHEVRRFFELPYDLGVDEKIKVDEIVSFFKSKGIAKENIPFELRKIEAKNGYPPTGETRHGKVWQWLRLEARLENTLKEMDTYAQRNTTNNK